eukprot:8147723-Pyramimonas_sp.AAC.1
MLDSAAVAAVFASRTDRGCISIMAKRGADRSPARLSDDDGMSIDVEGTGVVASRSLGRDHERTKMKKAQIDLTAVGRKADSAVETAQLVQTVAADTPRAV